MPDKMNLKDAIERVEIQDASGTHGCDCEMCVRARELVLDAAKLWDKFDTWATERQTEGQAIIDAMKADET